MEPLLSSAFLAMLSTVTLRNPRSKKSFLAAFKIAFLLLSRSRFLRSSRPTVNILVSLRRLACALCEKDGMLELRHAAFTSGVRGHLARNIQWMCHRGRESPDPDNPRSPLAVTQRQTLNYGHYLTNGHCGYRLV